MPTTPLDIINCTLEEFFHQMVITKNIFKDTVVSYSRGSKQHVGKISAAFLWPTRHRVVSKIYGTPIIYNWKQADDTAAQGIA